MVYGRWGVFYVRGFFPFTGFDGVIEKIFSVKVRSVNIINIKGKSKRFKGIMGKRNDIKKAIVTLETGNTIDLSAGV